MKKVLNLILLGALCATMINAENSDILQQWSRKGSENKSVENSSNTPTNNDNIKIDIVRNFITQAQNSEFDEALNKYGTDKSNGLFGVKEGLLETIATNSTQNNTNEIFQNKQEIANIKKPKISFEINMRAEKNNLAFVGNYLSIQALSDNTIINDIVINRGNCRLINKENLNFLSKPLKFGEVSQKIYFQDLEIWNYNVSPNSSNFNVNPTPFINFGCDSKSVLEIVLKTNGGDFHYGENDFFAF